MITVFNTNSRIGLPPYTTATEVSLLLKVKEDKSKPRIQQTLFNPGFLQAYMTNYCCSECKEAV